MSFNRCEQEKGTVVVMVAILVPVILAGLGLAIDAGAGYDVQRRLQKAVDAAAMAAAQEIRRGGGEAAYRTAALDGVARNGFGRETATVDVYTPPITGPQKGKSGFVEVVAHADMPLYFMKPLYSGSGKVEARAIGGAVPGRLCVLALNETESGSLNVSGSASVDITGCAVQVNSSSSSAALATGSSSIVASSFDVVGGYGGTGFSPSPNSGSVIMDDPLENLEAPSTSGGCKANRLNVVTSMKIEPGKYCGGISVQAGATLELEPGIYILTGGLDVRGGAKIKGEGVMFYNTSSPYGPITISGSATVQLSAPKTGYYEGILFFADRNLTSTKTNTLTGDSESYLTGTLYFPSTPVTYIGNAGAEQQKMLIIGDKVEFQGNCNVVAMSPEDGVNPLTLTPTIVY